MLCILMEMVCFPVHTPMSMILGGLLTEGGLLYLQVSGWVEGALLCLPNLSNSKLQMPKYVKICGLLKVHGHNSAWLPCIYIGNNVVPLKEHMNLATLLFLGIKHSLSYYHCYFLNICMHQLKQEQYVYCKVMKVPLAHTSAELIFEKANDLHS